MTTTTIEGPYWLTYNCDGGETNFPYPDWVIFAEENLHVFRNGIELSVNIDYFVTSILVPGAVVPISFIPHAGDVIELNLILPYTIPVNYQDSNALKAESLNLDNEYLLALIVQNDSNNSLSPRYKFSSAPQNPRDLIYPTLLKAGQFFMMSDTGFVAASVTPDPAASVLKAQLASDDPDEGAALVNTEKNINLQIINRNMNYPTIVASEYIIQELDYAKLLVFENNADTTTLPSLAAIPNGWYIQIRYDGPTEEGYIIITPDAGDEIKLYGDHKFIGASQTSTFVNVSGVWHVTDNDFSQVGKSVDFNYTKPDGEWMFEDGRALSRADYNILFGKIGIEFGPGDGSTTFNIPNSQGRSPLGSGSGSGLSPRAIADIGGEEKHGLTEDEGPTHGHKWPVDPVFENQNPVAVRQRVSPSGAGFSSGTLDVGDAGPIPDSGLGTPHNTMHPFIVKYPMIKVF